MWYGILLLTLLNVSDPVVVRDSTFRHAPPAATATDTAQAASAMTPPDVNGSDPELPSAPEKSTTSWSSHFAYARHGIFVRVALDGVDAGWFLLDTGAGATVVDTRIARDRHLHAVEEDSVEGTAGTTRATVYELGNVSVNGAVAIAVTGVGQDLSGFPSPDGKTLAGILGSDFLGSFAVRIDFATHEVTFSGVAADSTTHDHARVHFDVDHGTPRIPVTLDGHVAAEFRIDTGLHGTYDEAPYLAVTDDVWQGLARAHAGQLSTGEVRVRGLGDDDVTRPAVRIARLAIGAAQIQSPWIVPQAHRGYFARSDAVSLLGNGVLEHFSPVTIDYLAGTLYLTVPN